MKRVVKNLLLVAAFSFLALISSLAQGGETGNFALEWSGDLGTLNFFDACVAARNYTDADKVGGFHLPTVEEATSLIGTASYTIWTGTHSGGVNTHMRYVNLGTGVVYSGDPSNTYHVRAVRYKRIN